MKRQLYVIQRKTSKTKDYEDIQQKLGCIEISDKTEFKVKIE